MAKEMIVAADDSAEVNLRAVILDFQQWVRYLWLKKWIPIIVSVLGGGVGLWYSISREPVYIATTTFVVESSDQKSSLGRLAGVAAVAGIDLGNDGGGLFQGDNILELYKSRRMLVQALLSKVEQDSEDLLIDRYIAFTGKRESWKEKPALFSLDFKVKPEKLNHKQLRLRDSVLTEFAKSINKSILSVDKPDKKLSIVKVDVTSKDEVFSKAFNENLVKQVNEFYIHTKTKKSSQNVAILQRKVDSVTAVMTGAIYSAARVTDATPNLNPTRQTQRIAPTQEAQFSAETSKAVLSQLIQNLELAKMNLLQEQPLIQLIDVPIYPLPKEQFGLVKGFVLGSFLFGFLAVLYLVVSEWYRKTMADPEG